MKKLLTVFLALSVQFAVISCRAATNETITPDTLIKEHLRQYGPQEMFSAIQVSIRTKDKLSTYTAGNRSLKADSQPVNADDLFNIGSITKSFTAALAVMAESEGKLKLENRLNSYLSAYSHWGQLRLDALLNMSTGIPNYSDAPRFNYLTSKNLRQYWSQSDLINLVYSTQFNPPLKPGYFYSNTGYALIDMILSKVYNTPFQNLLSDKILTPLKLQNTFYPLPDYPAEVLQRLVRGYSYNVYENPELLGQDVTENNLSWAGAAGALVANSEDVVHWIEHLFIDGKLLTPAQKKKMQTLIAIPTGSPLAKTDVKNPQGFGLGIVQIYDSKIGHYWRYEGQTLGYRALYIYVPCNQVIISALFNSATNGENDHAHLLVEVLYQQILKQDNTLICKESMGSRKS